MLCINFLTSRTSCDAVVVVALYVWFVSLPPAAACLLYKWLLAPMAATGTVLLSHYLIRDHVANLWGSSSFRPLIETLLVSVSASVTGLFANQLSGVPIRKLYLLLPLLSLPVPILLHRVGLIDAARPETIIYEYCVYVLTLLLLLPAAYESLDELDVRMRAILHEQQDAMPRGTPRAPVARIIEQRMRRAVEKSVVAAAIFAFCLLLVNLVRASLWPLQSPVNSTTTALTNNTNDWAYAPRMSTAAQQCPGQQASQ